ncbi:hypothetical protein F5884DRAFT_507818 [Xylogone sp. PMI_703]|nr:hypothetical protein F5884DRAFT_507818 [Xylogone sp. PMI_703]
MRKGTRSCAECRRRKIRCIFGADHHTVCKNCQARGLLCMEQRRSPMPMIKVESYLALQERVTRLEKLIESSGLSGQSDYHLNGLGASKSRRDYPLEHQTPASKESGLDAQPLSASPKSNSLDSISPTNSLFDNAIWQRSDLGAIPGNKFSNNANFTNDVNQRVVTKHSRSRVALLTGLPTLELLSDSLNVTSSWWQTWRPLGAYTTPKQAETLESFVIRNLSSGCPQLIGLAILCIAVSVQQLDAETHYHLIRQLHSPPGELFHEYYDRVDRIIINDSEYASSLEGIEAIMMSSKMMMNLGAIKRSWILCRRGISYGQLLGMHRQQRISALESDAEIERRQKAWIWICYQDVYLSLLLDLPCGSYHKLPLMDACELGSTFSFQLNLLRLSIRVIDRCQMGLNLSTQTTNDIQGALDLVGQQMPSDFWDVRHALADGSISHEEYFDSLSAQFWYHQIRVSVQMPLMIQSLRDRQLDSHRVACLEASRDLLKLYRLMRCDSGSAFKMVNVIDYQAFICAALLILGILGYGTFQMPTQVENRDEDRHLVQLTMETFRQSAKMSSSTTARQALQGLETLELLTSKEGCSHTAQIHGGQKPYVKVVVPYTGTITISPGNFFRDCESTSPTTGTSPQHAFTFSDYEETQQLNESRVPGSTQSQQLDSDGVLEFPLIDLDWNSVMNMNLDENWAWLSDLNTTM